MHWLFPTLKTCNGSSLFLHNIQFAYIDASSMGAQHQFIFPFLDDHVMNRNTHWQPIGELHEAFSAVDAGIGSPVCSDVQDV